MPAIFRMTNKRFLNRWCVS